MAGEYEPTAEQRKAIEAYVKSDLMPLIESVLVKRLSMAAVFMSKQVQAEQAQVQHQCLEHQRMPVTRKDETA